MTPTLVANDRFTAVLDRLVTMSREDDHDPFQEIVWPATIPDDHYWMSRDLLSVHGTAMAEELTETQLMALSKWESINFYSLNVHGIRELLTEVIARIHMPGFEPASEYFHHFVDEENEHMWFFAKFCRDYAGKLYESKQIKVGSCVEPDIEHFLVFMRINIFEEIVDYYNMRMAEDETLPSCIREINHIHHKDESRHIAFGRQILKVLYLQLEQNHSPERLSELGDYIRRYIRASLQSLYNPTVYRDAGLPDPYKIPARLIQDPSRQAFHDHLLKRSVDFLVANRILSPKEGVL